MKIILKEDQLNRIVFNHLDKKYGYLKPFNPPGTSEDYVQFIDKNGDLLMDGIIDQELLVKDKFWIFIKEMFGFISDSQVSDVIKKWTFNKFGLEWDDNIIPDYILNN